LRILTGDIGGTHTRLAIGSRQPDGISIAEREVFSSHDHDSLAAIIGHYPPAQQPPLDAAAFGVAGPVKQGISRITNLPWEISQLRLAQTLGLDAVYLLNDLEALAWGIDCLSADERVSLHGGSGDGGNRAVVAAGTGLGEAGLYFDGRRYRPFATEGGHVDFAPCNAREIDLLRHLQQRHGHVSWERVLSGPGLVTLYEFVLLQRGAPTPDWLRANTEPAAHITNLALAEQDELCVETLDWFVQLYGREAGNAALKMKATGGVYLGGGIAPKILPALQRGGFMLAFLDKGRMQPLLEGVPVQVIRSEQVALKGLVHYAVEAAAD